MNCPSGEILSPLISTSPKNEFRSMIGGCSARTVSGATRIASVEAKRTSVFIFRSRTATAILLITDMPSCAYQIATCRWADTDARGSKTTEGREHVLRRSRHIKEIVTLIEDRAGSRALVVRLRELETREDELNVRLGLARHPPQYRRALRPGYSEHWPLRGPGVAVLNQNVALKRSALA